MDGGSKNYFQGTRQCAAVEYTIQECGEERVCSINEHNSPSIASSLPPFSLPVSTVGVITDTAIRETWFLLCGDRGCLVLVCPYLCFNIFKLAGVNLMRRFGLATAPPPDASSGPRPASAWRKEDVLPLYLMEGGELCWQKLGRHNNTDGKETK